MATPSHGGRATTAITIRAMWPAVMPTAISRVSDAIDDLFKASDYRLSPFELESALIEHPAVAEAAVVPSPDPLRLAVPKAFLILRTGYEPSTDLARELFGFIRERLAPYKRIRRLEFSDLPKTISGKIRRAELRIIERDRSPAERRPQEFFEARLWIASGPRRCNWRSPLEPNPRPLLSGVFPTQELCRSTTWSNIPIGPMAH